MQESPILQRLTEVLKRPVEGASLDRAVLHVMDWMGCAAAGRLEPAGQILSGSGRGDAYIWGGLGNILEMDDVDKQGLLHPGPTIVPAALVAADNMGASGPALLAAIVRGYEATIRLGRAVGPAHYALWHNTATCGPIGAATACADLYDLSEAETVHAMALAVSQAAGFWQTRHHPESHGKQLHTAHAARAGLEAAQLAKAGFQGPSTILEGVQGFFAAMCPGGEPGDVVKAYGSDWLIHEVSFKPWPACRHAHAAIDAALHLRGKEAGGAPIKVSTYADALAFCDKPEPITSQEAKFSLQHAVAVTLARGAPTLEDFLPAAIEDETVSALRRRVSVSTDPGYQAAYPKRFGATVSIGADEVAMPDALGDPENPVSKAQLRQKADMLLKAGGLSTAEAGGLVSALQSLVEAEKAAPLIARIREILS